MYVGITRAKKNLYLSCAKRRKMWGEYKYYNPSRFINEIPSDLINYSETELSSYSSTQPSYTFKKAVETIKSHRSEENSDGSIKSVSSFGKNFVAPSKKVSHNTSFVIKHKNHEINKEERIKNNEAQIKGLMEDNPIKRMLLEKKKKEAELNAQKTQVITETISPNDFKPGDRVFHSKFGIGKVIEMKDVSSSTMIIVDFGKSGEKALDAGFSQLKKF